VAQILKILHYLNEVELVVSCQELDDRMQEIVSLVSNMAG
jgi:hypothetical protein